jgi:hypothetical protein
MWPPTVKHNPPNIRISLGGGILALARPRAARIRSARVVS